MIHLLMHQNVITTFQAVFKKRILISNTVCVHLGNKPYWNGDRMLGSNFKL
jgi:Rieske Fe-S protein